MRLDFNADRITSNGYHYSPSLFTKALIRLSKVVLNEKKRVLILYPNFYCASIPLLVISSYYSLLASHKRPRILLLTNRKETCVEYKGLGNEGGYSFVDFIYSGILSNGAFNRLKPIGAGKGRLSSKVKEENGSVFISNFNIKKFSDYDIIFVENAQLLAKRRYNKCLDLISNFKNPIVAIQTSPNVKSASILQKKLNGLVWGWSEEIAENDLLTVCKIKNTLEPEARFPAITFQALPLDQYHNMLVLSRNAFVKSLKLRANIRYEPENLSRIFIDLSWLIRRAQNLICPIDDLEKFEIEQNLIPTHSRINLIRGNINRLPDKISETLELENALNLCESALQSVPTKGKEIQDYLSQRVACCVVSSDKSQRELLIRRFPNFSQYIHNYENEPQICRDSAYILGLTGSVEKDYCILKWANANKITICGYSFENQFLKNLQFNRQQIALQLSGRLDVLKKLNVGKYL